MANDFESRKDTEAAGKVVGSADVRKRKVSPKERAARAAQAAEAARAQGEDGSNPARGAAEEPKRRRAERTRFTEEALRAASSAPVADAASGEVAADAAEPGADKPDEALAENAQAAGRRSIRDNLKVIRGAKPVPAVPEDAPAGAEAQGGAGQEASGQRIGVEAAADGPAGPDAGDGDERQRRPRSKAADKPRRVWPKVVAGVIAALVLVAAIVSAVFVWNRSYRYDDAADFQGTWYAQDTATPIAVDAEYLYMNDEVKYAYTLDVGAKTIEYTFGPLSGQGRYWFSSDRQHLVIEDGEGFSAATTLLQDARRAFDEFAAGSPRPLPSGEGVTVLSRTAAESSSMSMGATDEPAAEPADGAVADDAAAPADGAGADDAAAPADDAAASGSAPAEAS